MDREGLGGGVDVEGATTGGGRGREDRGPTPVEVATAELKTAARSVTVAGTVEPIRTVGINSQLPGALLRVNVEEGDRVGAGQVLASIDSRELQAQLEVAVFLLGGDVAHHHLRALGGGPCLDQLAPETRLALLELAAVVADDFPHS